MKTATSRENAQTHSVHYPHGGNQALRQKTKVAVKLRKDIREKVMENALTYRLPMEVTHILKYSSGDCYPVCPRCVMAVEREYMRFCDRCGQKLGWSKLKDAVTVYPGYRAATIKGRERHLS